MLATIIIMAMFRFLDNSGFDITFELDEGYQVPALIIFALTVIFWFLHLTISEDKDFERYSDIWDESEIQFVRVLYIVIATEMYTRLFYNYGQGTGLLEAPSAMLIVLAILDVVNMVVIFNSYSFDVRESIVDSIFLQISNMKIVLAILILFMFIIKFTIVGTLLLIIIVGGILKLFLR